MDLKTKAATISVISNTTLVIFKLAVGIITGSVSITSEAIHSGLDLVAALIALFSVRLSSLPPDEQHRYGHGKIENVSGTIEAVLIF
ncbi:MAG: cation diffusion facilitator family transporter, partial [Syntrophomonadaceae bacterium]|nr:cation diffusion facilitator family transporter [Syntrophomonadaceae bacterium]